MNGRRWRCGRAAVAVSALLALVAVAGRAQVATQAPEGAASVRAQRFLAGRVRADGSAGAEALRAARLEQLRLTQGIGIREQARFAGVRPHATALSTAWQPVGPKQVTSQSYGLVSGRVTSVAIDPADATGNTVYVGTTGGGVWKSTNAAGAAGSVTFEPLTDTLPVFSLNAGTAVLPSLSIGAVSVNGGVVLAGTGDPNDATDSYYGEGILRSTDGGATWTIATESDDGVNGGHSFVGLGVAGFAWSTVSPNTVVVAISQSAEGILVNAPNTTYSVMGLYYSTDAGVTWQMATILDGSQYVQRPLPGGAPGTAVTAVVWNPVRQRFYAAVRFHGYYESSDGMNWTRLAHQPGTGLTLTACPTYGGSANCPMFRGALAVQPGTGDTFALTVDANNRDQGLWRDVCGMTGGTCASTPIVFGLPIASTALEAGSGSSAIAQADYNLALSAVANGTDTLLFVGTTDLYRCSIAAGCVLRNTTNAVNGCATPAKVAPAQHAVASLAGVGTSGAPLVFVGNDGGLWRSLDGVNQQQTPCSTDDAKHFENLNGGIGSLAEVVSFAQDPSDRNTLLTGLGAKGTAATSAAGSGGAWTQVASGEGGTVAIDQANPQNWYVSTEAGVSLKYCGNGSACGTADFAGTPTIGYAQVGNDASLIAPPWILDPALTNDILVGTCRVWRGAAQSGSGWPGSSAISTDLGSNINGVCGGTSAMVRSLAAGGPASGATAAPNAGSIILYAGMAGRLDGGARFGGHVFADATAPSSGASTTWADIATSSVVNDMAADGGVFNPGGFDVSSVTADPHDSTGKTVYATVMGFAGNGSNAPHVYRSVDGGAHWTNISSNLPNAPANALLVDPNDANTLYVAMDTGVYATQQVTSCTTSNCWSVLGTGLPTAPVTTLQEGVNIPTGDGRTGELRAGTYGRGIWEIPLLTAAGGNMPAITVSATSLSFGATAVGTLSAGQTITVTNSGSAALAISQVAVSGDFTESDTCVGAGGGIAIGASCTVQVQFLPSTVGPRTGTLTIYANVTGGQATVSLTGTATAADAVVLNPVSVAYSGTNVGSTSAAQDITISNTSSGTATLQTETVSGDFAITANTCGTTLGASSGCTVSVAFRPTASGTRSGTLTITDSAGTQTAALSGSGVLPATDSLSSMALSFGQQQLGTASPTQSITVTNSGDSALTLIAAQVSSGYFTVVNSCGNSLNGHSTCAMQVAFVPKSVGAQTGVLTISDAYRTQTVAMSGTGIAPAGVSVSPVSTMSFAATGVGTSTTAQTVTLTNNGGMPLTIQNIAVTGDFAIAAGTNSCGSTLAVGSACTMQIVFTPTAGGVRSGTVTITDNSTNSPQIVQLSGVGVDFALAASGSTSQTVNAGSQAVYGLLLTSASGVPGAAAFTCSGAPANTTCVVNPASAVLGGTTVVTVTIATNSAWLRLPSGLGRLQPGVWFAVLLPGLLGFRSRRMRSLLCIVMCFGLIAIAGCGASRVIPETTSTGASGGAPTASGTYNLTVTGTSAGLTRSVGLTLVVK